MKRAGEFELINAFIACLPHPRPPHGPGDDTAVLPASRGRLCVTTDAVVEDVHFSRPFFSLGDVGHKALAVNLSDLAAMGARPRWWLCALGLPASFTRSEVVALARGMAPLATEHRLALVGGNLSASPVLSVTLTLGGEARRPLLRSGARPGDLLYVSGTLGAASAGLVLGAPALVAAQKRPKPQLELGRLAAGWAHAAIDLSDGLLADLGHLCQASKVGADLDSAALPLHPDARRTIPTRALQWALTGGEDYQLLLAVPPRHRARAEATGQLTCIGAIRAGRGITLDGARVRPSGFDHFAPRNSSGR